MKFLNPKDGGSLVAELYNQYGKKIQDVTNISINLASPDTIRNWSYGEVTKPETINYRSFKPERDGLFCEKIFGPVRNWECNCGKYKRIRYRGVVCDRCGVEVTHSKVRRERMGHIELAVPIAHIWFLKSIPSHISYLLGVSNTILERIIYYESYVVIDPGDTGLNKMDLLKEEEYEDLREEGREFDAKMGGEAVLELLATLDVEDLSAELRYKLEIESSAQRKLEHLKRLRVSEAFLKSGNRPENMVLTVLPVLPPDLRPLVPLEGGRFATSDLNDLYRRVINRNNRLKKLIEIKAPDVILRNEMRMLQEAVDTLFDNGRRTSSVKGEGKRPLKSLSDLLKGKQGRFRQNLLGKRVDYSGRSVIVVGPELKVHQCGLPKMMALELFKPFVIQKLEERNLVQTVKSAKKFVEKERPEVWDILEEVIRDHPVMLNRAPTLHRLGIQAFFPVLVEGKAIRLHPLVCSAFNADFDGDQMAVHVPLSFESQIECRLLMLSANNLLRPSNGEPVMVPSQDMVLGIYYLTKMANGRKGEGRSFSDAPEVFHAIADGQITLHSKINVRIAGNRIETTAGRVIFNEIVPKENGIGYKNELMKKSNLEVFVGLIIKRCGTRVACIFLDDIKNLGYEYATKAGVTFGIRDLPVPQEKDDIIKDSLEEVTRIRKQYTRGIITEGERYNKIIDIWTHTTNEVSNVLYEKLKDDRDGFNSVYMMLDAKARGSQDQIKQLAGMRGLMQKPQKKITGAVGEIIENPILSNFKDGLSGLEYFISTHGARKGLADTALKTADAGYLTRRLVDVVQDIVVTLDDCGTTKSIEIEALHEGDEIIEELSKRIVGRTVKEDIYDPITDEMICPINTLIDEDTAFRIDSVGIERVLIRSVLTCEADRGICKKCYGRNLASGEEVDIGEAVGIMAAQSIGEPGTQLTLRTFHIGGTASRLIAKSKEISKVDGYVKFIKMESVSRDDGIVVMTRFAEIAIFDKKDRERYKYKVPQGSILHVEEDAKVKKGDDIFEWDPYNNVVISNKDGIIEGVDLKEGETLREIYDEQTGMTNIVVVEDRSRSLHPHVKILGDDKTVVANIAVPAGAFLQIKSGDKVLAGDILFKMPRDSGKSRDITGGLPRVAELFEARRPKDGAIISEIDGIVEFKMRQAKDKNAKLLTDKDDNPLMEPDVERGNKKVIVHDENRDENNDDSKEYAIPIRKHMRVHDGDRVSIGDRLCEGSIDPHDILRVLGEHYVQKYLIDEIQAVYRLQGVKINDKHIEVIVSQMLSKVVVQDAGDTDFLQGDAVDRKKLRKENQVVIAEGNKPASFKPVLLGITKASLTTESFLSAASFQETTKVLAKAAVEGKVDHLKGLKENLIMGNLIPAGTGSRIYRNIRVKDIEADMVHVGEHEVNSDFDGLGGEIL